MEDLIVHIEGIGWWAPGAADWDSARVLLREGRPLPNAGHGTPAAQVLPPNVRRRAPEPVLIASEVGAQACAMAARDGADLPCVFASIHGDLAITDAMCATLAANPRELSPTQFHNSVHNAAVGYWTVATRCHAASSAVSAWHGSFGAGLLDAAVEAVAGSAPVLFVAGDIAAHGPLATVIHSAAAFGAALVLSPEPGERSLATLRLRHEAQPAPPECTGDALLATALPLFAALARAQPARIRLSDGVAGTLAIGIGA